MAEPERAVVVSVAGATDEAQREAIRTHALPALQGERIVAVPTDTIYGVACLAQSSAAVKAVYDLKGRSAMKPVAICVDRVEAIPLYGKVTVSDELLRRLLPGPVTVVFERTPLLNPELNPNTPLIGIRVPDHPFVRLLVAECGGAPLALTSANLSNAPSALRIDEFRDIWHGIDAIFDGGEISASPEAKAGSTVVDLSLPGKYKVIRDGSARAQTLATLHEFGLTEEA
jgi:tRNA threonylcarbamoyl adenosine modification protein (Sua5/YciO/YrdC/YwlC family)